MAINVLVATMKEPVCDNVTGLIVVSMARTIPVAFGLMLVATVVATMTVTKVARRDMRRLSGDDGDNGCGNDGGNDVITRTTN